MASLQPPLTMNHEPLTVIQQSLGVIGRRRDLAEQPQRFLDQGEPGSGRLDRLEMRDPVVGHGGRGRVRMISELAVRCLG